jgi:hypothetical protein
MKERKEREISFFLCLSKKVVSFDQEITLFRCLNLSTISCVGLNLIQKRSRSRFSGYTLKGKSFYEQVLHFPICHTFVAGYYNIDYAEAIMGLLLDSEMRCF